MRNQYAKHLFYLVFIITLFLSCNKRDTGSLPSYQSDTPYYTDLFFEEVWKTNVTSPNDLPISWSDDELFFVNPNFLILKSIFGITALNPETGEIVWQSKFENSDRYLLLAEIMVIENTIYFFNVEGITVIDLVTGVFLGHTPFRSLDGVTGTVNGYISYKDYILLMMAENIPTPALVKSPKLYRVRPNNLETKLIVEVDSAYQADYDLFFYSQWRSTFHGDFFIDSVSQKAFFRVAKTNEENPLIALYEIDLTDDSFVSYEIGRLRSTNPLFINWGEVTYLDFKQPFSVYNNKLFMPVTMGMNVVDLESRDLIHQLRSFSMFIPYKNHFLALGNENAMIDTLNFSTIWSNRELHPVVRFLDISENSSILVEMDHHLIKLFDLQDGQLLSRTLITQSVGFDYVGNMVVSRKDGLIYILDRQTSSRQLIVKCFKSPIPLD